MKKSTIFLLVCVSSSYSFTLEESFIKSLQNDPEIQLRENELKKIKYDIEIANGLKYPSLDLKASANNSRTSLSSYRPKNGENISADEYSLTLKQPIYDGLQSNYEKELQKNRYESAQDYLKEAQNSLALSVTQNYINVLKTNDMIGLSSESYEMSKDIYEKTARKVEEGFGTKLEFEKAKGNLEESSVNLAIDQLNFNDSMQTLYKNLQEQFNVTQMKKPIFNYKLPNSEEDALKFALINHPSMAVSLKNIKVALNEQKRDLKVFHPDVNLVGSYTLNNASHKEDNADVSNEYQVGLELAYNLYNGGKDSANNKKSLQIVHEKKILTEKSSQDIANRLALAWNSYMLNQDKLSRLEAFLKTRKLILETTYKEFYLGSKDLTSLIDAHLDYISTKRNTISTSYDLLTAHFRVLEALGVLSDEILGNKKQEILIDTKKSNKPKEVLKIYSYSAKIEEKDINKEAPAFQYFDEKAKENSPILINNKAQ